MVSLVCYKGVARVLQEWYKNVTRMLQECYKVDDRVDNQNKPKWLRSRDMHCSLLLLLKYNDSIVY